jgi:drug/metabolite transporter (DMT)-like permease
VERWLSVERNVRVCAVLGAVAIAFSSILVRLSHASPSTAAIFRCLYALPVLGMLAWLEDRRLGARGWRERRVAIASGVFFSIDLILWHHSIGDVGAGLATVLANIQVVLVPLVAWAILSERPGRQVLAALPVALIGVLLISGALEHGAYGRNPTRGAVFGVGAGIAYVGFLLLLRHGGSDLRRPAGPLFDATATAAALCVIAGLILGDGQLVPSWPGAGWLITLALTSQVLGWLLITTSLPRLPAAMTSLLLTVQPVGSVALAALIFAESPSPLQLAGVALVLVALLQATRPRRFDRVRRGVGRGAQVVAGDSGNGGAQVVAGDSGNRGAQAIAGASGSRSSAASMSASENSGSSSWPAKNAS